MSSPALLILTSQLPWPPVKGGTGVSWRLISYLATQFEVTLCTLLKGDDSRHEAEFRQQLTLADYVSVPCDIPRSPGVVLRSYLSGRPVNLVRNWHPDMAAAVSARLPAASCVLIDHYEMCQYVPDTTPSPVVLHAHNAEYVMWARYAAISRHPLRRVVTWMESLRIRAAEARYCRQTDTVLAFPNDREALIRVAGPRAHIVEILPAADDQALELPDIQWENTRPALMYAGTLTWEANIDGLLWFGANGWPALKGLLPDITWYLCGSQPDARLVQMAAGDPAIVLTGFVEDLETYYGQCRVMIAPLRFGSGVKLKVLNTLLRGLPIVTTPIGTEGLPVTPGVHLAEADNMADFVAATVRLIQDRAHWEAVRDASRTLGRERLSAGPQLAKVRDVIQQLISASANTQKI
ncbi:MAG: glycosyltransferase family 4 protein [Bacteroidia bacterium]|nr:glycosyltransferase family 4 protein [Bacteroidia bacterium]